jgi:predicted dehydrogenase
MSHTLQRREFLKSSAAVAGFAILPSSVRAFSPNEKLRTAHVGVGGKGRSDLSSMASHAGVEVAALCDVDSKTLAQQSELHPKAKLFRDYREMISSLGDSIDAVVVSTPDHTHAPAAMTAFNHGKPVYCQKPLTHEVFEARQLRLVSEKKGLVTQMGIQASATLHYRKAVELIRVGEIGKVHSVIAWSYKNWGYDGPAFDVENEVPDSLDWNLWLGTAGARPYVEKVYHPGQWRKQVDFGTGTLGDMGVHIFDTPFRALELTAPRFAETTCRKPTGIGHPESNKVYYEFPGTKYTTDTLKWTWYDGKLAVPMIDSVNLPKDLKLPRQGSMFLGEAGNLLLPHVAEPQVFTEGARFPRKFDLEPRNHYHEWVDACMGNGKTSSPFTYGSPLTEALLLGVVANRFPGKRLEWDAKNLKVTNLDEANALIRRTPRDGFEVAGL